MSCVVPAFDAEVTSVPHAVNADHATSADSATTAGSATHATSADSATTAGSATHATSADSATTAGSASNANIASHLDWDQSYQSEDYVTATVNSGEISATGNSFTAHTDIRKTGYRAIAMLGYDLSGFGQNMVSVKQAYMTNDLAFAHLGGVLANAVTDSSFTVIFHILYVKTS